MIEQSLESVCNLRESGQTRRFDAYQYSYEGDDSPSTATEICSGFCENVIDPGPGPIAKPLVRSSFFIVPDADQKSSISSNRCESESLRDSRTREGALEAIEDVQKELQANVDEYKKIRVQWNKLNSAVVHIRDQSKKNRSREHDPMHLFGLLRFGFKSEWVSAIQEAGEAVVSGEDEALRSALSVVVAGCATPDRLTEKELAIVSALLWILSFNDLLTEILAKRMPLPHFSFDIVYGAALCHLRKKSWEEKVKLVLSSLEERLQQAAFEEKGHLAVGLAYVWYHLWDNLGNKASWLGDHRPPLRSKKSVESKAYINKAIEYAKLARRLLQDGDPVKELYALNQHFYYLIEGGEENAARELDELAQDIAKRRSEHEFWQYRYDDSMSWYYFRLAVGARSAEDWTRWITSAANSADAAAENGHLDSTVETHTLTIRKAKADGFSRVGRG